MSYAFDRDKFSESLNNCHNIIRDNDKLSPEAAFDEISKVLFVKIRFERDEHTVFTEDVYIHRRSIFDLGPVQPSAHYYQYLFE